MLYYTCFVPMISFHNTTVTSGSSLHLLEKLSSEILENLIPHHNGAMSHIMVEQFINKASAANSARANNVERIHLKFLSIEKNTSAISTDKMAEKEYICNFPIDREYICNFL